MSRWFKNWKAVPWLLVWRIAVVLGVWANLWVQSDVSWQVTETLEKVEGVAGQVEEVKEEVQTVKGAVDEVEIALAGVTDGVSNVENQLLELELRSIRSGR